MHASKCDRCGEYWYTAEQQIRQLRAQLEMVTRERDRAIQSCYDRHEEPQRDRERLLGLLVNSERDTAERIAEAVRGWMFPDDDGSDTYKRAYNNALWDARKRLLDGRWRQNAV